MSVFTTAEATPSRMAGTYRYLLLRGRVQRESRDTLEQMLMPESLLGAESDRNPRAMVRAAITEALAMRLLAPEGDEVGLHPGLPTELHDPSAAEARLPLVMTDLILDPENPRNHDFAIALAWYLAQEVGSAPGDYPSLEQAVVRSTGERLGFNDVTYGQFRDWSRYLGFVWAHAAPQSSARESRWLVPDPTVQIRWRLPVVFREPGPPLPIREFVARLGRLCPVLEGGAFRNDMDGRLGVARETRLSSTTAHALLRLRDEGELELTLRSDATALSLPDGTELVRVSEIAWRGGRV